MSTGERNAGLFGMAAGAVAAGLAAGVAVERRLIGRTGGPSRGVHAEPLGSLHNVPVTVTCDDEVELYAETSRAPKGTDLAIVFIHGYALNSDLWHFQRRDLASLGQLVLYDHRSHGRSGDSDPEHATMDQLARDLQAVLQQVVWDQHPDRPVVLVGHSMGGMTAIELCSQRPEWFGDKILGVALLSTSAGGLDDETWGLPGPPGRLVKRLSAPTIAVFGRAPAFIERGRRASSDLAFVLTREYSFASPSVPAEYVEFASDMISATPVSVLSHFYPLFDHFDRRESLEPLHNVECVVVCGDDDKLTPLRHAEDIVHRVPGAELVEVAKCGHLGLVEHHDEFNAAIHELIVRVRRDIASGRNGGTRTTPITSPEDTAR